MDSILSIALSGMDAARQHLDAAASNIANMQTMGALPDAASGNAPQPYTPIMVSQHSLAGGGVATSLAPVTPPTVPAYAPSLPFADRTGLVAAPNVDLATQGVDQLMAAQAYAASASLVGVSGNLEQQLLNSFDPGKRAISA